jgi:hypothetical protein
MCIIIHDDCLLGCEGATYEAACQRACNKFYFICHASCLPTQ